MKKKYTIEMNNSPTLKEFERLVKQNNMTRSFAMEQSMKLWLEEIRKTKKKEK